MRWAIILVTASVGVVAPCSAQPSSRPPASMSAIRQTDLRRDMDALAGDAMRGREAGTVDEMRASIWVADAMRRIGVKPFGEDSSWFQWWTMRRTRISGTTSTVTIARRPLALWRDIAPTTNTTADVSGSTIFLADPGDTSVDVRGKVVIAALVPPLPSAIRTTTNTWQYNYTRAAVAPQGAAIARRGAVAAIIVGDSISDEAFAGIGAVQSRGTFDVVNGASRFVRVPGGAQVGTGQRTIPILLARRSALEWLRADGQSAEIHIRSEVFETPSANVIGVVPGTDPALRGEYVLFSSHQDHDGVRYDIAGDSIWNGADDNASTSVALLAIARAWVRQPSRRSALFVFHGAEERGLLGSRYHALHPVVPLQSIVAVLNGDMIGRNHPDTAALLGSQPPHRNSLELVTVALAANGATSRFVVDTTWDRPDHPEFWYFRSDHVPYAERKVPSLFFTTLLHPDYHTPRDDPQHIDYAKLTRMTQWMFMTGWMVGNADRRPAVDPGFELR